MNTILFIALALIVACLLSFSLIPFRFANAWKEQLYRLLTSALAAHGIIAISLFIVQHFLHDAKESDAWVTLSFGPSSLAALAFDRLSGVMLILVSFLGLIVTRYSLRYLDGEATQGNYFRWLAFTLGAVLLMVLAGNLLVFFAAWVMTSLGLHRLLLHYPHRRLARQAAATKFIISRLGDLCLLGAIVLIYDQFGTLDWKELFGKVEALRQSSTATNSMQQWSAWLLILGAITKSVQFPFHVWLPVTLETPTPVSALMHAGIVNAGGFLILRTSPFLALVPEALQFLAMVGTLTACYGGMVMMTQTSVKQALAYSTIAQMGFMMLQCGLGAFSAAMLHIIAHSLYKAYAFLSSGSVLTQARTSRIAELKPVGMPSKLLLSGIAGLFAGVTFYVVATGCGIALFDKPGGPLMAAIFCMAMSLLGGQLMATQDRRGRWIGMLAIVAMNGLYLAGYCFVDSLIASRFPRIDFPSNMWMVYAGIVLALASMLALQVVIATRQTRLPSRWVEALRIHAMNGFYLHAIAFRLLRPLVSP